MGSSSGRVAAATLSVLASAYVGQRLHGPESQTGALLIGIVLAVYLLLRTPVVNDLGERILPDLSVPARKVLECSLLATVAGIGAWVVRDSGPAAWVLVGMWILSMARALLAIGSGATMKQNAHLRDANRQLRDALTIAEDEIRATGEAMVVELARARAATSRRYDTLFEYLSRSVASVDAAKLGTANGLAELGPARWLEVRATKDVADRLWDLRDESAHTDDLVVEVGLWRVAGSGFECVYAIGKALERIREDGPCFPDTAMPADSAHDLFEGVVADKAGRLPGLDPNGYKLVSFFIEGVEHFYVAMCSEPLDRVDEQLLQMAAASYSALRLAVKRTDPGGASPLEERVAGGS